jgi:hypothetical protein
VSIDKKDLLETGLKNYGFATDKCESIRRWQASNGSYLFTSSHLKVYNHSVPAVTNEIPS